MRATLLIAVLTLAGVLSPAARAAAMKTSTFGCKAPADAQKALYLQSKKDAAGLAAFTQAKLASGACVTLGRGLTVTTDMKKPPLTCVRLSGDLDCYWTADVLVDLNPAEPERPSRGTGRRH